MCNLPNWKTVDCIITHNYLSCSWPDNICRMAQEGNSLSDVRIDFVKQVGTQLIQYWLKKGDVKPSHPPPSTRYFVFVQFEAKPEADTTAQL